MSKTLARYFTTNVEDGKIITSQVHTDIKIAIYTIVDSVQGSDITDEEWQTLQKAMDVLYKLDK